MTTDSMVVSKWTVFRDACTAVRELLLIVAVAAFLLMPQRVQQFLTDAGIRSVAGIEFDLQKFKDAQSELRLAQSGMAEIQEELNTVNRALFAEAAPAPLGSQRLSENSVLSANRSGPTVDVVQLRRSIQAAQERGQSIERHLKRADQMSRQAVPTEVLTSPEVVFGNRSANAGSPARPR